MEFRLAVMKDLPRLKAVYQDIIRNMKDRQIEIWDDVYPCAFFEEDIRAHRLYLLLHGEEIVSAFALCQTHTGQTAIQWREERGRALYLDRLGVNVNYGGRGVGSWMLEQAKQTAKGAGADYLRLFVVDINAPAIGLYVKNGFTRGEGVYVEEIDHDLVLREYGFEAAL